MERLKQYLHKYRRAYIVGGIFTALTSITSLFIPWILKYAIDDLLRKISYAVLIKYAGLIILVAVFEGIFRFLMRRITISASRKIEYDLRNDYFRHLQRLTLSFYDQQKTGDLMSRGTNDLNSVRMLLGPGIMYSSSTLVTFVFAFAMMLIIDVKLSVMSLMPLIILSFFIARIGAVLYKNYSLVQEKMATISHRAQEYISGIKVIKAFVQEKNIYENFRKSSHSYLEANLKVARIWGIFFPLMFFMSGLSTLIILYFGGKAVILNKLTLGEFVAFNGFLTLLVWPMMALGWVTNIFQAGMASMKRINQILDTKPSIVDKAISFTIPKLKGDIEFRKLTFAYQGNDTPVLKDINLKVRPGETIALMGRVGSGKTTLVNLIPHLYEINRNMLFVDDKDVNDIPHANLRENIGFVSQEPFLFSDTIQKNLIYGRPDLNNEKLIKDSLEISSLSDDVNTFPKKLNTLLGERGINLSGGQKQRLAIARAIIINPSILILDDCFSSMDTETERLIMERLQNIMKDKTTIIISHRTSTIRLAKRIIVLEEGEIVEQGTHKDLLEEKGLYADLFRLESLKEELEFNSEK